MKNSYYKRLFDNWIARLKLIKKLWLSNRKFSNREEKLQIWIKKMYELNKKYNKENK